ncbi:HAD family hydrolase [Thalassococcus sp. BH17M4-6]|uniref:HAD family hydrolase n=1 Tax=Thalassococcus sp. BH17M4-6 TaxID=3413148 RepID=UPI003BC071AD
MPDKDLVIFDCDGVLADSEVISADTIISELARVGIDLDHDYVFRHFIGKSFPGVAANIRASFDVALPEDFEERYRAALADRFATQLRATPGLHAMIARLGCRSCVATSSSPRRVAVTLRLLGLTGHFGPHVFTASEVTHGKPAPDLFLLAARRMGTEPERCLVIEDSAAGIAAGIAAGMQVWHYTGGGHFRHRDAGSFARPTGVRRFDNWAAFYQIDASLNLDRTRHGQDTG